MGYSIQPRRESEIRRSSIDDLPAELLGKILQYVVFAPGEFQVQLDHRGGNPYDVTLVSRYWRDVACSTPQLWVILPGHYPLLWDLIVKRSGTLELRFEWYGRVPKESQIHQGKVFCSVGRRMFRSLRSPCSASVLSIAPHSTTYHTIAHGGFALNPSQRCQHNRAIL